MPAGGSQGPRTLRLALLLTVMVPAATYAANCFINLQAKEVVIGRCVAEDRRLETAVDERNELRLDETDWMVILYGARRRYVAELCQGAIYELRWWRWNLGRDIEVDVSLASQRDISRALERAAATCGSQVERLEQALAHHLTERGGDPDLVERVREVSSGQAGACAELRGAVADSRQGFWPALRSRGAKRLPEALSVLMPQEADEDDDG